MRISNPNDRYTSLSLMSVPGTGGARIVNSGLGVETHMLVEHPTNGRAIIPVDQKSVDMYIEQSTPDGATLFFWLRENFTPCSYNSYQASSNPISMIGALCVIHPQEMRSTPLAAIAGAVSSETRPDASVMILPPTSLTAFLSITGGMLSSSTASTGSFKTSRS